MSNKQNKKENKLIPDPKYKGVRLRYAGNIVGFGEDWIYYIQYKTKDGTNKVRLEKLGKASEGWTSKKASLERVERQKATSLTIQKNEFNTSIKNKNEEEFFSFNNNIVLSKETNNINITKKIKSTKKFVPNVTYLKYSKDDPHVLKSEYSNFTEIDYDSMKNITLYKIWEDYCFYNQKNKSLNRVKYIFRKLAPFYHMNPIDITTRMIQDFRIRLENEVRPNGRYYQPATIAHFLKLLKILINHGIKRNLCKSRQDLFFEYPKFDNKVTEFLTKEQLEAYKKALDEEKDIFGVMYLKFALYTGMRSSSILGLKWEDIDLEKNLIYIRGENAKNGKNTYIPLPNILKKLLPTLPNFQSSIYIFEGKDGKKRTCFRRMARRVKNKAGLPKNFRPTYMLRHNFATQLASNTDADIYTIQRLMTHRSPVMTQRYAHLMDKKLNKSINDLIDIIGE